MGRAGSGRLPALLTRLILLSCVACAVPPVPATRPAPVDGRPSSVPGAGASVDRAVPGRDGSNAGSWRRHYAAAARALITLLFAALVVGGLWTCTLRVDWRTRVGAFAPLREDGGPTAGPTAVFRPDGERREPAARF